MNRFMLNLILFIAVFFSWIFGWYYGYHSRDEEFVKKEIEVMETQDFLLEEHAKLISHLEFIIKRIDIENGVKL